MRSQTRVKPHTNWLRERSYHKQGNVFMSVSEQRLETRVYLVVKQGNYWLQSNRQLAANAIIPVFANSGLFTAWEMIM